MAVTCPPAGLTIGVEREPEMIRLVLVGELDLAAAPVFERRFEELRREGVNRMTIDLSELRFLDSSGLRELLFAHRRLTESGGELLLGRGPRAVQRLFELTRTDQILRFID